MSDDRDECMEIKIHLRVRVVGRARRLRDDFARLGSSVLAEAIARLALAADEKQRRALNHHLMLRARDNDDNVPQDKAHFTQGAIGRFDTERGRVIDMRQRE